MITPKPQGNVHAAGRLTQANKQSDSMTVHIAVSVGVIIMLLSLQVPYSFKCTVFVSFFFFFLRIFFFFILEGGEGWDYFIHDSFFLSHQWPCSLPDWWTAGIPTSTQAWHPLKRTAVTKMKVGRGWSSSLLPVNPLTDGAHQLTDIISKPGHILHDLLGLLPFAMSLPNRVIIPLHVRPASG